MKILYSVNASCGTEVIMDLLKEGTVVQKMKYMRACINVVDITQVEINVSETPCHSSILT